MADDDWEEEESKKIPSSFWPDCVCVSVHFFSFFKRSFAPVFFSSSSSWRLGSSRKRKTRIRNKKKWKRNWWRTRRGGGEERRLLVGRSDTTWHSTGTYTTGWVGRAFAYPPTFSPTTQYTPGGGLCLSTHTHTTHARARNCELAVVLEQASELVSK